MRDDKVIETPGEPSILELRIMAEMEADPHQRAAIEATIIRRANALVVKNLRLANDYAKKHYSKFSGAQRSDVRQHALMGLMEASKKFDPKKGKFSSIAVPYMRKHVQKLYASGRGLVRHAKNPEWRPSMVEFEMSRMESEGLHPTFEEACNRLGVPAGERGALKDAHALGRREYEFIGRFNEPFDDEDDNPTLDEVIRRETIEKYRAGMEKLPPIVRECVSDMALGKYQFQSAERLGLCRPSVMKYRTLGLKWLRYFVGEGPEPEDPLIVYKELPKRLGTAVPNPEDNYSEYALRDCDFLQEA
jgi:RNA polymerase sigma factor (sigma-70 family)